MSDWTALGFPCPLVAGYGYDRDIGIIRTPFESPWTRQKQGFKSKRESFTTRFLVGSDQLASIEAFFASDAYTWFTMPLVSGAAVGVADHTVRAVSPYRLTPISADWWWLDCELQSQIAAEAADLSSHGFSTTEETCCLADDIQCCEGETPDPPCSYSLLNHFDTDDLADATGRSLTNYGGVTRDPAVSKFGTGSARFVPLGDYLQYPASQDFAVNQGNWCVDLWVRFNSIQNRDHILQFGTDIDNRMLVYLNSAGPAVLRFGLIRSGYSFLYADDVVPSTGQWYHIALARKDGNLRWFVNGQIKGEFSSVSMFSGSVVLTLGTQPYYTLNEDYLDGWIDEIRFTRDCYGYWDAFTPPTAPYIL